MQKTSYKGILIVVAAVVAFILLCVFVVQSAQNKAINLQEMVRTADSDIKVQEYARVSKVYNLADCVKEYDRHEAETLKDIAQSMSATNSLQDVNTALAGVVYNYPELKSNENYKQFMTELSIIENTLAQYRENYNKSVEKYNGYCKKFPTRIFLNWTGYEVENYQRLDYQAPVDAPANLFGE